LSEEIVNDTPPDQAFGLDHSALVTLLEDGDVEILGRMPNSSNTTLLVRVTNEDQAHLAIYKPGRGERPLWDFPPDLYGREAAMYRLADAIGWDVIPPTTITSGPLGEGSVQAFVNGDFSEHYFTLYEAGTGIEDLQKLCLLDYVANNTDRKSGHCLLGGDGRVYGIDNGLAFHRDFKLRTVIWDFALDPIPPHLLAALETFAETELPVELACLLDSPERHALSVRLGELLATATFPEDETGGHRYPWPLV